MAVHTCHLPTCVVTAVACGTLLDGGRRSQDPCHNICGIMSRNSGTAEHCPHIPRCWASEHRASALKAASKTRRAEEWLAHPLVTSLVERVRLAVGHEAVRGNRHLVPT